MDSKDAWKHTWSTLLATCSRLETEIGMQADSPLLKGVLDSSSPHPHTQVHRRVADARQQLVELQTLVSSGAGQASTAFISALSDRISTFAQQLNAIKQQQRSDYAVLLQEEQQLLEELAVLELTLNSTPQEQHQQLQVQDFQQQEQEPALPRAWPVPAADTGSSLSQHARNTSTTTTSSRRRSSDTAADCVCTSPDRPGQHTGGSPAKGPNAGGANSNSSRGDIHAKGSNSSAGVHAMANSSRSSSGGLPPEVQAYDAFLARHGATGGWHPEDHATFMAILKAHRGDYNAALAAAVDALPLQTRASVIAHCRWHADLCELEMRKRIALVNWRAAKEAAKAAFRAQAVALGEAGCSAALGASLVLGSDPAAPADQQGKEVRQLKQQLVQQWKQEQAAARAEAARAAQEQRQLQRQAEAQQRQQRQEELRRQLEEAKAAKQVQQQQQQQEAAAAAAAKQAPQLTPEQRQRLAHRNAVAVERQRALLAAKAAKQKAKARAQAQLLAAAQGMAPQVNRDPSRLLSATGAAAARAAAAAAGMKEAAEQSGSSRGRAAGGFVLHVAHKATPNWVAGVQGL